MSGVYVGVALAESAGKVVEMTEGWYMQPAVHMSMWRSNDAGHGQRGKPSEREGRAGYGTGDVVGLLLNLDAGTLTAYKNGGRLGVMVPNARVKELGVRPFCWALDLRGRGEVGRRRLSERSKGARGCDIGMRVRKSTNGAVQ